VGTWLVQEAGTAGVETAAGWPSGVATDWVGLGLALALVGSFFLGTALFSTSPRELIEERFGLRRPGLRALREPVFQRVQLGLGFAFLMAGFGVQLFGRAREPLAGPAGPGPAPDAAASLPAFWIGAVVIAALVLWAVGGWWARVARVVRINLRRPVREFFADLFSNPAYQPHDLTVGQVFDAADLRFTRDPFDALIVAAAHDLGLPLITRDAAIRESGSVKAFW
jgi:PIN domain nuclease of toxin-antitoxin system